MNFVLVYLLVLSVVAHFSTVHSQNYCNANLCPSGRHISCNGGRFGSQCPANARVVRLSSNMKNLIVRMHNVRRNNVARGSYPKFDTAYRMPVIQWDNDLARIALMNAKQCIMQHDACRNTPTYRRAGQNIGRTSSRGSANRLRQHLIRTIQNWFQEYRDATASDINSFSNPKVIGHFTLMVSDRVTRIGCGTVRFTRNRRNTLITTCNYAATNYFNLPVYQTGNTAAGCTTGTHSRYGALCSASENVNPNVA